MAAVFEWSIPAWVVLLVIVAVFELVRNRNRRRRGAPLAAKYVDEFTAMFYGTKRVELDHRDSTSVLREEDAQGGPPRSRVDLERGVVRLDRGR